MKFPEGAYFVEGAGDQGERALVLTNSVNAWLREMAEAAPPDALRAALERLLRATEFPVMSIDNAPGSGRVSMTHLEPLLEAAEQARAALAAHADSEREGTR